MGLLQEGPTRHMNISIYNFYHIFQTEHFTDVSFNEFCENCRVFFKRLSGDLGLAGAGQSFYLQKGEPPY